MSRCRKLEWGESRQVEGKRDERVRPVSSKSGESYGLPPNEKLQKRWEQKRVSAIEAHEKCNGAPDIAASLANGGRIIRGVVSLRQSLNGSQ